MKLKKEIFDLAAEKGIKLVANTTNLDLHKILREEFGINVEIGIFNFDDSGNIMTYYILVDFKSGAYEQTESMTIAETSSFDTWDIALNTGLTEALNVINNGGLIEDNDYLI